MKECACLYTDSFDCYITRNEETGRCICDCHLSNNIENINNVEGFS